MYINLCEISFGSLAFKRDLYGPLMLAKRLSILIAEVAMYKERGSPQAKRERQQKRVMQGRVSAVRQEFSQTSQDAGLNHPRSRFSSTACCWEEAVGYGPTKAFYDARGHVWYCEFQENDTERFWIERLFQ